MFSTENIIRPITKEDILRRVSQVDIFRFYLGIEPSFGNRFFSPLRSDKNASCSFYMTRTGDLCMKDYAQGKSYSCFEIVKEIYGLTSFLEVLNKIDRDLKNKDFIKTNIELPDKHYNKATTYKKKEMLIQFEKRDFYEEDIKWWNGFGITKSTLKENNVYAVKRAFLNKNLLYTYSNEKDPCYAYYFKDTNTVKLYRPLNKDFKWLSNVHHTELQGTLTQWNMTKDYLIITKSLKDVMTLNEVGIKNVIAVQSETSRPSDKLLEMISNVSNPENIYVWFDNDTAGKAAATQFKNALPYVSIILIPDGLPKDPSDYAREFGLTNLKTFIDKCIEIK